ncbi:DNA-binding FadR family transcriptional regulator [Sphingomonas naasensis]|uniref:FadR family transcriptional regulator n=1 Tax=Sphingomonas naasensis TaxID=1344951 RepID=A0A4S1WDT8_9SPHN|nr:FadR/GntR family transcriptional regulator [Sphingomonas naasensis]NIJ22276.1 DNA-binding FadR family transcriptional regulator [Sphingomonas naasensis]TGX40713.1 FadR family transcriptional regulator [Sphingomonas naasensis]
MATMPKDELDSGGQFNRTLTLGLVDAVGSAIVRGEYQGHPFPTEAELSREHGISRSVTREAIKMITAKGLLGARPKIGTFVQPQENWNLFDTDVLRWLMEQKLSRGLLRQFNELRMTVEPQAAAWAARRATPAQVTAIQSGLTRMREAADGNGDPLAADIDFHVAVLRASGNPFLSQFRDIVTTALHTSIRVTNRQAGGKACIPDHEAVYVAIAAGKPDIARDAMAKLIGDVLDYLDRTPEA